MTYRKVTYFSVIMIGFTALSIYSLTTSQITVTEGFMTSRQAYTEDELRKKIETEAKQRYLAPIDAKIDPVWKAIPGYNGIEVDIEQTLKLARSHDKDTAIHYITREIEPSIKLTDLGAYPIYKGNPHKPMVSLMINVAWGEEHIPSMLETLRNEHVHATFFFDGSWLSTHIDIAQNIAQQGHELANHAYSHPNMSRLTRQQAIDEISKTQLLLSNELLINNTLFAPPSGDFNQQTLDIAAQFNLHTVLWTLDTVDWKNPGAQHILHRIATRVEPGTLILMHPTISSSQALPQMIQSIKQKGLVLGTVSELISSRRIPLTLAQLND